MAMMAGMAGSAEVNLIREKTPRPAPKRQPPRRIWPSYGQTPANKRAAARLEAHRAIWANTPSADHMTRQRIRRAAMGRL